jgi:hypothetical protein
MMQTASSRMSAIDTNSRTINLCQLFHILLVLRVKAHTLLTSCTNDKGTICNSAAFRTVRVFACVYTFRAPSIRLRADHFRGKYPAVHLLIGGRESTTARWTSTSSPMRTRKPTLARMESDFQYHVRRSTHPSLLTPKSDSLTSEGAAASRRLGHVNLCILLGSGSDISSLDH